uniref:Small ribosomal subunit protein uS17 N-terminal domain-containing protein n=1 Tax=Brassica oleracea var. oleracea TaxID=109376 RepID=A0A0D3CNJ5_BRAOL
MAEQAETAFLKQPKKKSGKGKKHVRGGNRFWKNIGLGFQTPRDAIEDFLRSVRAVALLRIYRWSEISVEKIRELKDRIARREWRSDLPTVLPVRAKRLDIFPRDIQKQVTEAKKMGTLLDLNAIIAAQLGLTSGEGPSTAVPRSDD